MSFLDDCSGVCVGGWMAGCVLVRVEERLQKVNVFWWDILWIVEL